MYTGKSPFDVQTTSNSVEFTYVTYCLEYYCNKEHIELAQLYINLCNNKKYCHKDNFLNELN